jgi:hypothetical protein
VLLSCNLGTLTSWDPLGHSGPLTGLINHFNLEEKRASLFWGDYQALPAHTSDRKNVEMKVKMKIFRMVTAVT